MDELFSVHGVNQLLKSLTVTSKEQEFSVTIVQGTQREANKDHGCTQESSWDDAMEKINNWMRKSVVLTGNGCF